MLTPFRTHPGILICFTVLILCSCLGSGYAEEEAVSTDGPELMITVLRGDDREIRTGLAFPYDETTVVCSYSDIKGAARIRIRGIDATIETSDLLAFSETMDLAILSVPEELPIASNIVSSSTLNLQDRVSYWIDQSGRWMRVSGTIHQMADTGKRNNVILIDSASQSNGSSPLYDLKGRVVGWIRGKRAIPMDTIASLVEKQTGKIKMSEINSLSAGWKFTKPERIQSPLRLSAAFIQVSGPASFPFRMDLPEGLTPTVSVSGSKFHVRYEHSGVCVEVRATPLQENDVIRALTREENLIFTDFLRAELVPYSVEYLTGFKASYEDTDPLDPYALEVFYTVSSNHLYLVSIGYPRHRQEEVSDLIEKIFASFRF